MARQCVYKVHTVGFVASRPEYFDRGTPLLRFRLACSGRQKTVDNERETLFVTVQMWGKQATALRKYIGKGDKISISGSQNVEDWKDRSDKIRTDIVISADFDGVELCGSAKKDSENNEETPF